MARLPYPIYGLEHLHLFRRYQTREEYQKATGSEPPPFDEQRQPKYWMDTAAATSLKRNVVYDSVIATGLSGQPVPGPDGKPMLDVLVLSKDHAASVNIPPNLTNVPGADVPEAPMPLRPLEPGEELFFQFGGVVAVKNVELFQSIKEGFTAADRTLLQSIAKKLGV